MEFKIVFALQVRQVVPEFLVLAVFRYVHHRDYVFVLVLTEQDVYRVAVEEEDGMAVEQVLQSAPVAEEAATRE